MLVHQRVTNISGPFLERTSLSRVDFIPPSGGTSRSTPKARCALHLALGTSLFYKWAVLNSFKWTPESQISQESKRKIIFQSWVLGVFPLDQQWIYIGEPKKNICIPKRIGWDVGNILRGQPSPMIFISYSLSFLKAKLTKNCRGETSHFGEVVPSGELT